MARARNIKPSFFINDVLAECEPLARILFIGLWTIADRAGRLPYRPKKIKIEILPYDDCDVESLILQLEKHGFIVRYIVDNNFFIQVVKFSEHQHPHMKEPDSTIPAPDEHGASMVLKRPLIDSLLPITDSLNPISDSPCTIPAPDEHGASIRQAQKKIIEKEQAGCFNEFWDNFPKQRAGSKEKAKQAFVKALQRAQIHEILDGVKKYRTSDEVNRGFAKGAAAWLNDDRWTHDYSTAISQQTLSFTEQRDINNKRILDEGLKRYEENEESIPS